MARCALTKYYSLQVLNFSIAYGKTAHGLSKDWGVTQTEAQVSGACQLYKHDPSNPNPNPNSNPNPNDPSKDRGDGRPSLAPTLTV